VGVEVPETMLRGAHLTGRAGEEVELNYACAREML